MGLTDSRKMTNKILNVRSKNQQILADRCKKNLKKNCGDKNGMI